MAQGGSAKFLALCFWHFAEFYVCVLLRVCVWDIIRTLCGLDVRFKEDDLMKKEYRKGKTVSNSNSRKIGMDAYYEIGSLYCDTK